MPAIVKSILAILAGYVAMAIAVVALTAVVTRIMPQSEGSPGAAYMGINLCYSFAAAVLGGFTAAWIAGRAPIQHGYVLAALVFLLSIFSAIQMGNKQPRGYQIALALLAPAGVMLGAYLKAR